MSDAGLGCLDIDAGRGECPEFSCRISAGDGEPPRPHFSTAFLDRRISRPHLLCLIPYEHVHKSRGRDMLNWLKKKPVEQICDAINAEPNADSIVFRFRDDAFELYRTPEDAGLS